MTAATWYISEETFALTSISSFSYRICVYPMIPVMDALTRIRKSPILESVPEYPNIRTT